MTAMARALAEMGMTVDVATTNDNDSKLLDVPIGKPVEQQGVCYRYFERTTYPYTTSAGLARWLRKEVAGYDIVHTHALFSFATSAAANAARRRRVPYIVRPLGTLASYGMQQHALLKRLSWLMVERNILRHAAAVHFTSEAERLEAARLGDWRGMVVPLGVEVPDAAPPAAPVGDPVFLFMSRLHPKKRVGLLFTAFRELLQSAPSARLIVAGDGTRDHVEALKQLSVTLGIAAHLEWMGHVSGADKQRLWARAHAFVLPSINENFGIAAVEAMAAGVPVVLTRGVAIHVEVEEHGAGVVVADDAPALAAGMRALLAPGAREAMAERALSLAHGTFSVEAMQRGLRRMYEQVAAR